MISFEIFRSGYFVGDISFELFRLGYFVLMYTFARIRSLLPMHRKHPSINLGNGHDDFYWEAIMMSKRA